MNYLDHASHSAVMDIIARLDGLPPGLDPDFDNGAEELERQFAELRLTLTHD
ncbi:MAG TPA: hypothetical protein VFE62_20060 [Gemmataceae bacterium]|nr:hypothetical protein [Gemmataceae bacterium]